MGLRNGYMVGPGLFGLGLALLLSVEALPPALWAAWLIGSQVIVMVGVAFATVNIAPTSMTVTGEAERRHAFAVFQALIPTTAFFWQRDRRPAAGLLCCTDGALPGYAPTPHRLALWLGPLLCVLSILPLGADPARS